VAVIQVPPYSPAAFQRDAEINDLVAKQVEHFLHVEARLPRAQRSGFRLADLRTENDAAQYIAYMTATLQGKQVAKPVPARQRDRGLAIAAGADSGADVKPKKRARKGAAKKSGNTEATS
jgi:hypothetical protein